MNQRSAKMVMTGEATLDQLTMMVARAGLTLPIQQLQQLLPGVVRSDKQVAELRRLVSDEIEPACSGRVNGRAQ
jgi:hypothetical protein